MKQIPLTQMESSTVSDEDYDAVSKFKWCAAKVRGTFYAQRNMKERKNFRLHQFVWEMHNGPIPPGMEIDHINGNSLDNRLENLRVCTHAENGYNRTLHRKRSSKYKGVRLNGGRWQARIAKDGICNYVGCFDTEEEAARAYDKKAKELFGKFANPNFKEE